MLKVLGNSWALLLGMGLLMVGNGVQATLMGVRGAMENFSTFELSIITSAYFAGFLFGSRLTPELIRRVGHVRVFAALASFISAALVMFPVVADPWFWTALRVIIGFGFSGVYVTAESWLNNAATNETRGQTLSAYMVVQMLGIVSGQVILGYGDPSGFVLFIIPSVLVSISFAPILLSVSPTPAFDNTHRMSLRELFAASPLSFVSMVLLGGIFAALFGMGSVYASMIGLSVGQVSTFIAVIFFGPMVMQYPIGWLSDRMDRRQLIFGMGLLGGLAATVGFVSGTSFPLLLTLGFLMGATANPLYSLLLAYLNDYLDPDDMAAASGGLVFINGLGAITGPVITGWLMGVIGPHGFWLFIAILMFSIASYSLYRMTQRAATPVDETSAYVSVMPTASPVAVGAAQEWAIDQAEDVDNTSDQVSNQ
ncbi:Transporter, Major facilitator superfamily [Candidatus Rhodobacter oscarellae]|uniref:Transporter, Major facilitator superfamily n=1 Tax=Candidatus Rhodobacter oscarellae TaxID=1675527 RepID=A0A0J9E556_9RHOB|nr:MFS transporter [Candidatus Rhodobacter lobularis]KMW57872.1 Transporter, Major facilitator superfamily [Candidatus Rhodobacter lobularis]